DSCARRTSAAEENCCRTPPIAFPVEPDAISARSASTTSRAPRSARWYAMQAPTEPEPATTIRAIARAPSALRRSKAAAAGARRDRSEHRASPPRSSRPPEKGTVRARREADRGRDCPDLAPLRQQAPETPRRPPTQRRLRPRQALAAGAAPGRRRRPALRSGREQTAPRACRRPSALG